MEKVNSGHLRPTNEEIIKLLKDEEILPAKDIWNKLDRRITFPGLMKRLKLLSQNCDIFVINTSKSFWKKLGLSKKRGLQQFNFLNLKGDHRISKYYLYLPLVSSLNRKLNNFILNLDNNKKYSIVKKIIREYANLEMFSKSIDYNLSMPDRVRKGIREEYSKKSLKEIKGWRISNYEVETVVSGMELFKECGRTAIMNANVVGIKFIKINGKEYFLVGDEFIPKKKLTKFLEMLEFPPIVRFLLSDIVTEMNISNKILKEMGVSELIKRVNNIVEMMQDLFMQIVRDSQVKF